MKISNINFNIIQKAQQANIQKFKHNKHLSNTTKGLCMAGLMALSAINMACIKPNNRTEEISNNRIENIVENTNEAANITNAAGTVIDNQDFIEYGRFGEYFIENIPENEDIQECKNLINELCNLAEQYQGCRITNPAYLNGLSAEEIKNKCIIPAQKITNNETFGENQKTLALIGFEPKLDENIKAFENDFKVQNMKQNIGYIGGKTPVNFEKAFLDNYDNIVLIQPNEQDSDVTLDIVFEKLNNSLDKGAPLDIAIIGHGINYGDGIALSVADEEKGDFDISDFHSDTANSYSRNIKEIFSNSMQNNYTPRIIGLGCYTDFLQDCMSEIFSDEDLEKLKVFGTPYAIMDTTLLGFLKDRLYVYTLTSRIKEDIGLLISISENKTLGLNSNNNKDVEKFKIDEDLAEEIYNNYINNNITYGTLSKTGDMVMEYCIVKLK